MKTRVLMFILACTILLGIVFAYSKLNADIYDKTYTLHLPTKDIFLIVAADNQSKTKGLGGMESLPQNQAMLFVFDQPGEYGIWMKDMKFPIDIFWLDDQKKIISLEHNISPDTYPKVFSSTDTGSYVLETNEGFAKENNLVVGKVLDFDLK